MNQIPPNQHNISLQTAIEMTTLYRQNREVILDPAYRELNILPLSETFNKEAFTTFHENANCKAIRIYYGMDEGNKVHAIIVGVNEDNEDLVPNAESITTTEEPDPILELAQRCPPDPECPPASPLNTD